MCCFRSGFYFLSAFSKKKVVVIDAGHGGTDLAQPGTEFLKKKLSSTLPRKSRL
jgi:N-acetylmuramoyl-L-alanine amidase